MHPDGDVTVVSVEGLPVNAQTWTWLPDPAVSLRDPELLPPYPPQYQQQQGAVTVSIQDLPEDEAYGTAGMGTAQNATAWTLREDQDTTHALISQAFSRPGMTAATTAAGTLGQAESTSVEQMLDATRNWWHAFLTKSYISIPDPRAEQFFWLQMHRIGATVREHGPMVDLSGPGFPWNHKFNKNAGSYQINWPGIWWNWNQQGAYTPFHKANHPRLGFNQDHGLWKYRENLEINAGVQEGEEPRYNIGDRAGIDHLNANVPARGNGNLAWALFNSWEIYDSIRDETHLREILYPLMAGNLRHIETSFIVRDGVFHLPRRNSPEYAKAPDLSYEIAPIRALCRNIIEAETRLDTHENLTPRCEEILEKLVDYHTDPVEGIMIGEGQKYDKAHRHFSHLIGIYQIRELHGSSEPERAALARKSVEHWDETLHAPKEGETEPNIPGKAWPDFGTAGLYAVLDDAENAYKHFQNAMGSMQTRSKIANMFTSAPINETPLFAARVLMDLLVQSRDGEILVFPATPGDWDDAVFHDLRLPGAFLVSARREEGVTRWVRIKSEAGEPCIVRHTLPGSVSAAGSRSFSVEDRGDGFVEIDLQAGEEVVLYSGAAPSELSLAPVDPTVDTERWGDLPPPLDVGTVLPPVQRGEFINIQLEANRQSALIWHADPSDLPTELVLTSEGVLRGFPVNEGLFAIPVSVEDPSGEVGHATLTLQVQAIQENFGGLEGNILTAQGANSKHPITNAVDGLTNSKWLDNDSSTWFQVTLPQTHGAELSEYSLTSANDVPGRDPRSWTLWAREHEGADWQLLDERTNETFPERFQQRTFTIPGPVEPAREFRFEFVNNGANDFQIAEIALKGPVTIGPYHLLYGSARGLTGQELLPDADDDHDGLNLVLESFFGSNPLQPDHQVSPGIFTEEDVENPGQQWMLIRFQHNPASGEIAASISTDLKNWDSLDLDSPEVTISQTPATGQEHLREVEVGILITDTPRFVRFGPK